MSLLILMEQQQFLSHHNKLVRIWGLPQIQEPLRLVHYVSNLNGAPLVVHAIASEADLIECGVILSSPSEAGATAGSTATPTSTAMGGRENRPLVAADFSPSRIISFLESNGWHHNYMGWYRAPADAPVSLAQAFIREIGDL